MRYFMSRTSLTRVIATLIITMMIVSICYICMSNFGINADDSHEVFILMYHNIIGDTERPNKYEIRVSELERDMRRIRDMGLEVILPSDIMAYQRGERNLPARAVMLTFDDGYYSYIDRLLPLLDKYDMRAVVNVVGEYTTLNKTRRDIPRRYTYVDYEDIARLVSSGRVAIGYHSYGYHHIGGGRNGAAMNKGESYEDYKARLVADTTKLRSALARVGVSTDVYAYPYGAYSKCSDEILSSLGVRCTLSCTEGINQVTKTSSLYLMKRYNRSGISGHLEDNFAFFRG